MKRDITNKIRNNFVSKYIASNHYIIAALLISPMLIFFTFGMTYPSVYDDHINLDSYGLQENEDSKFYQYNGTPIDEGILDLNSDEIRNNITKQETEVFKKSFFGSLVRAAEVSFLISAIMAALIWGKMSEEGSIVYLIFGKESRNKAFLQLFLLPLTFIVFIAVSSSLAITSNIKFLYSDKSFVKFFLVSFIMVGGTMLVGYIFSNILSIISKNSFFPIFSSLLAFGGVIVFPAKRGIIMPFEYLLLHLLYGVQINDLSIIGFILIVTGIISLYLIFKRRSFY